MTASGAGAESHLANRMQLVWPARDYLPAYVAALHEEFTAPAALGGARHLRYRVSLEDRNPE